MTRRNEGSVGLARIAESEDALAVAEPATGRSAVSELAGALRSLNPLATIADACAKTLEHRAECKHIEAARERVLVAAQLARMNLELSFAHAAELVRRQAESFERLAELAERDAEAARAAVVAVLEVMKELRASALLPELPLEVRLRLLAAHSEILGRLCDLQAQALRPLETLAAAMPRFEAAGAPALGPAVKDNAR